MNNSAQLASTPANLINRLAAQSELLSFSGNSLEWLRFKRAFEQSTKLGNYSDAENASRLYNCLKGEAREAIQGLMMTSESAQQIMEALELRYGNQSSILTELVRTIRRTPSLSKKEIDIIFFAFSVQNSVAAMK